MGFLDFLITVAKAGIGVVVGILLIMTGSMAPMADVPTIVTGLIFVLGLIAILYGAYNLRHLDRRTY